MIFVEKEEIWKKAWQNKCWLILWVHFFWATSKGTWLQRANSIARSSHLTVSLKRLRFGDAGVDREEFLCRDHVEQAMWCRKQWDGRICAAFSVDSWALQQSLGIKVLYMWIWYGEWFWKKNFPGCNIIIYNQCIYYCLCIHIFSIGDSDPFF